MFVYMLMLTAELLLRTTWSFSSVITANFPRVIDSYSVQNLLTVVLINTLSLIIESLTTRSSEI